MPPIRRDPPVKPTPCPYCGAATLLVATSRKPRALFDPDRAPDGFWCWNQWTRKMHRALWPRFAYRAHWCPDLEEQLSAVPLDRTRSRS